MTFPDNPHVENVELVGNINYPNVQLSSAHVTFASTLNNTITSQTVRVTNTCEVPVKYCWSLSNGRTADVDEDKVSSTDVPANEIFDIKPVDGMLQPGMSEDMCVTYFAQSNKQAYACATMHVQGGPDTEVSLQAKASEALFLVEPRVVKFGSCLYTKSVQRDVTISNPSMCASSVSVLHPAHVQQIRL